MTIVITMSLVRAAQIQNAVLSSRSHYAEMWLEALLETDAKFCEMKFTEFQQALQNAWKFNDLSDALLLKKAYVWHEIQQEGHAIQTQEGFFVGPEHISRQPSVLVLEDDW
jgi:hypothetical protein